MNPLEWEKFYCETETRKMPWYTTSLDADLEAALQRYKITGGTILDIGTGPGTQAMALARLGFTVTATDISATAIKGCRLKAQKEGLKINFLEDDIVHNTLTPGFDIIFDRGCFHALNPEDRPVYRDAVRSLLVKDGMLFLKCFSKKETMEGGPYRFNEESLRECFSPDFKIISITDTVYQGTLNPLPKALFTVMRAL